MHISYQNECCTSTEGGEVPNPQLFPEYGSVNKSTCEIAESLEELNINKRLMPFSGHYRNIVERKVCIIQIWMIQWIVRGA